MLNFIKLFVLLCMLFTGGCAGMPELRKADVGALMNTAASEVDRAADAVALAKDLIDFGCAVRPVAKCTDARVVLGVAQNAVFVAHQAIAEARDRNDRFWFAADMVERAVVAAAEALAAARALGK